QLYMWLPAGQGSTNEISMNTLGGWHQVDMVHSGSSSWAFYLDGVYHGTATGSPGTTSGGTYFGNGDTGATVNEADASIYNYALSSSQITAHYQASRNGFGVGGRTT